MQLPSYLADKFDAFDDLAESKNSILSVISLENSGFAGVRLTEKGDFSFVCHHACTSTCIRSDSARFSAIIVSRP